MLSQTPYTYRCTRELKWVVLSLENVLRPARSVPVRTRWLYVRKYVERRTGTYSWVPALLWICSHWLIFTNGKPIPRKTTTNLLQMQDKNKASGQTQPNSFHHYLNTHFCHVSRKLKWERFLSRSSSERKQGRHRGRICSESDLLFQMSILHSCVQKYRSCCRSFWELRQSSWVRRQHEFLPLYSCLYVSLYVQLRKHSWFGRSKCQAKTTT